MKPFKPSVSDRVRNLKLSMPPAIFYQEHLPGVRFNKESGWVKTNALCPFHSDKSPGTFYVNLDTGAFRCHSCGAGGGDVIAFHMRLYSWPFIESLRFLERQVGV